uniref:DUF4013 domain-containing protein n=1 Tax=Thermomicrobium roseum TaxID=500 RepID=A0A7C5RTZ3_THERO
MDLGRAFSYVFQDAQWVKKGLIALVMVIIPIVGWLILFGYMLRIMRQTALGDDVPLPEWDDFGGDFVRGIKGFAIQIIWSIPVLILSLCVGVISGVLGAVAERGREAETINLILSLCGNCLTSIFSLAVMFVTPIYLTRFAMSDRFNAAFELSQIITEIRSSLSNLFIVLIVSLVLGFLALLGIIMCFVGILVTFLYAWFVQAHLYGQIRRRLSADGESIVTPSPLMPTA